MKKIGLFFIIFFLYSNPLRAAVLQVGAFTRAENIEERVSLLEEWGYTANLVETDRGYTRIRVENLADTRISKLQQKLKERRIEYYRVSQGLQENSASVEKPVTEISERELTVEKLNKKIKEVMGIDYRWGGSNPKKGFDCSGLLYWFFSDSELPRTVAEMYQWTDPIPRRDLRYGDFIFFKFESGPGTDHVGMYLGDGQFVHASSSYGVIKANISSNYYRQRLISYGRPPVDLVINR